MATVLDQNEDNNNSQGQTPTFNAAPTIGGPQGGGVVTPGAAPTQSATNSGRFNNLQKYISANKDFKQDQGGLAGSMVGNINNQAQNLNQNIQGAQNAFQNQYQQNVNAFTNPDLVNQALQNPSDFTQNQDNVNKFNAVRDASYTGPKSFQDLSQGQNLANLQQQSSNLGDTVGQAQSEGGRFNLLKQMFGNQNYSRGQQNLDNLMIQGNQNQLKQIQGTRQTSQFANQNLANANNNAIQQANNAQAQAAQVQADTRGKLNQAILDQNKFVGGEVDQAKQNQQQSINKFIQDLSHGFINQADYDRFSKTNPSLKDATFAPGINVNDLVSTSGTYTPQTVASAADYSKFAGLNKLTDNGRYANEDASGVLQKFNDPTQSGKIGDQYNFDVDQYLNRATEAQNKLKGQQSDIQKQIDDANSWLTNERIIDPNKQGQQESNAGAATGSGLSAAVGAAGNALGGTYTAGANLIGGLVGGMFGSGGPKRENYTGGLLGELQRRADSIRDQQNFKGQAENYNEYLKGGMTPEQLKGMGLDPNLMNLSNEDVLSKYSPQNDALRGAGSNAGLIQRIADFKKSIGDKQGQYDKLQAMMGKKLNVGNAPADAAGGAIGYVPGSNGDVATANGAQGAGTTYTPNGPSTKYPGLDDVINASRT